jgi:integrase
VLDEAFRDKKLSREGFDGQILLLQRWQVAIETQNERGKITFHSLRQATATAAIASGANVQTVSSLLGHANPRIRRSRSRPMRISGQRGSIRRRRSTSPACYLVAKW